MNQISENLFKKSLLFLDATLAEVIANLNESHLKIALIVNSDETLIGTISDGDIRRGLLRGLDLNSEISTIITRNPLVVPPEITKEMAFQIMQTNKIFQLPVIDGLRKVVGLHLWDELTTLPTRSNSIVIMAGGKGIRLRPQTANCPKPMLLIAGKPMLEHIINRAKLEGFTHFIISIHYLGHMIEDYFGDGEMFGVKIEYLREKEPLGTAGALGLLYPKPKTPFIVINGDVISDIRYGELLDFHIRQDAAATMAVRLHEWQNPFGVVHIDGVDIVGFDEKPLSRSYINAGVYVLDPNSLFALAPDGYCDMPSLFVSLKSKSKRTVVYPMHEPWLDVGRPDDLSRANIDKKLTL